jgi:hypothetical protein
VKIVKHEWKWAYPLSRREGKPQYCNWHHAAAKRLTPAALHRLHLNLGWAGHAYNLYITKNGKIHRGRPMQFCGGGAIGHWADIGVCLEGNYDVEDEMPEKQLRAAQEVKDYLAARYPGIGHRGHRQVPGNRTACPGKHFPYKAIMAGVPEDGPEPVKLTKRSLTFARQHKPHRAGWYNLGFRPFYEKATRQGLGKRFKVGRDEVTCPEPVVKAWWWDEAEAAAAVLAAEKQAAAEAAAAGKVTETRKRVPMSWLSRRKP